MLAEYVEVFFLVTGIIKIMKILIWIAKQNNKISFQFYLKFPMENDEKYIE